MRKLDPEELAASSVVANCTMNRERNLRGSNSYERDLGFDLLGHICAASVPVVWVDLCCGTGRALIEAAGILSERADIPPFRIEGIDLAGLFDANPYADVLTLTERGLEQWEPAGPYALVTCVHGLHYIGDKLAAIRKAVACISPEGLFIANLDLANFRHEDGKPAGRLVAARLRKNGLTYDARRRLLRCRGPRAIDFGLDYLGADDAAGPNYTGQPAVDSLYAELETT